MKSHVPKDAGVLDGEAKQAVPGRYGQDDREGIVRQQERDHPRSLETVLREVRRENLGTRVSLHRVSEDDRNLPLNSLLEVSFVHIAHLRIDRAFQIANYKS